jgi:YfiH family protein
MTGAWQTVQRENVRFVCSKRLLAMANLRHGMTTRQPEGVFNLSFSTGEGKENAGEFRRQCAETLGFSAERLILPEQVHGSGVGIVGIEDGGSGALAPDSAIPDCDALVTATPGLLLGITIADCLPIFLYDPIKRVIGIAHSGWRGTVQEIGVLTLAVMEAEFGARRENCLISIGPGIGCEGYEVCDKVRGAFREADQQLPGVFTFSRPNHWKLDLTLCVREQFLRYGVPMLHIESAPLRTNLHTGLFYSHRLQPNCPRMGAFIGMTDRSEPVSGNLS